jgi:DNA (cytosine-5)-methyltransferase 1
VARLYKVADLFCGAGGFSKGFENSGRFSVTFGIDRSLECIKTFKANHVNAFTECKDIRKMKNETFKEIIERYGPFDVVIGGPPCQGFSSIRPFRSINDDDTRNNLFEEFGRFVRLANPRVLVMENVVGLLTHKNGLSLQEIVSGFKGLGYSINYKVLNAVHYGIPQRRERLVVIGSQKGSLRFPRPTHFYNNNKSMAKKEMRIAVTSSGQKQLLEDEHVSGMSPALSVMDGISDLPAIKSGEEATCYNENYEANPYQKARRKNLTELTLHKSTNHTKRMLEIIRKSGSNRFVLPDGMTKSGFSTSYSRLDANEPSVTLTVNFVHPASNKCIHPVQDRALTPREGARLQSFDDDFIFAGNRASIVRQIGNAVPPLLGASIANEVSKFLDSCPNKENG